MRRRAWEPTWGGTRNCRRGQRRARRPSADIAARSTRRRAPRRTAPARPTAERARPPAAAASAASSAAAASAGGDGGASVGAGRCAAAAAAAATTTSAATLAPAPAPAAAPRPGPSRCAGRWCAAAPLASGSETSPPCASGRGRPRCRLPACLPVAPRRVGAVLGRLRTPRLSAPACGGSKRAGA
eukprot:scaffold5532_cov255-Prasinococcus_capsulatus_cf.AAC.2